MRVVNIIILVMVFITGIISYQDLRKTKALAKQVVTIDHVKEALNLKTAFQHVVSFLKVYEIKDESGEIKLIRHGGDYDGGYIIPEKALQRADVLMGYGIADDNSFEEQFSIKYQKPSFGFDCGIDSISSNSNLFTFVNECIGSDDFIYGHQNSSKKIHTFTEQVNKLNLDGKNIFLKMDIEGAEYDAFEDIIKHASSITGIALKIHVFDSDSAVRAANLLRSLQENFVLVHVHGNNCCSRPGIVVENAYGKMSHVIELSYINKNLITSYNLSSNQPHPTALDMPNLRNMPDVHFEVIG
jgi:hypothetical protein